MGFTVYDLHGFRRGAANTSHCYCHNCSQPAALTSTLVVADRDIGHAAWLSVSCWSLRDSELSRCTDRWRIHSFTSSDVCHVFAILWLTDCSSVWCYTQKCWKIVVLSMEILILESLWATTWAHMAVLISVFHGCQPEANETMDMGLVDCVMCLFTPQLSPVLLASSSEGWPGWVNVGGLIKY